MNTDSIVTQNGKIVAENVKRRHLNDENRKKMKQSKQRMVKINAQIM